MLQFCQFLLNLDNKQISAYTSIKNLILYNVIRPDLVNVFCILTSMTDSK